VFRIIPSVGHLQLFQVLAEPVRVIEHDQPGEYFIDLLLIAWGIIIDHFLYGPQGIMLFLPEHSNDTARNTTQVFGCIGHFQVIVQFAGFHLPKI